MAFLLEPFKGTKALIRGHEANTFVAFLTWILSTHCLEQNLQPKEDALGSY